MEYLLVFVEGILLTSHDMDTVMRVIKKVYHLKDDSVGPQKRYLGAD